jgi:hypothetical protein
MSVFIALTPLFQNHVLQRSRVTLTGKAADWLIDISETGIVYSDKGGDGKPRASAGTLGAADWAGESGKEVFPFRQWKGRGKEGTT